MLRRSWVTRVEWARTEGGVNLQNSEVNVDSPVYPRLPIILLIDNSAFMRVGGKIDILNHSLKAFQRSIEEDVVTCERADICAVCLGNRVTVIHDFSSIHKFSPPVLEANGPSLMGAGILKALALIMARKHYYKKNAIDYFSPMIIFFGGSEPDDFPFLGLGGDRIWSKLRTALADDISCRKYQLIPFGITPPSTSVEISECLGEIIVQYDEYDKVIYEKNGEIRSISLEREEEQLHASIDSLDNTPLDKGSTSNYNYLRIINALFPLHISLKILGQKHIETRAFVDDLFLHRIIDDAPPSDHPFETPATLPPAERMHIVEELAKPSSPKILGASVIGPLHIINGIPCQDAYAYDTLPSGHTIIAIADGLGSAAMSEIGSCIAVEASVQAIATTTPKELEDTELSSLARDSVVAARRALEEKAQVLVCTLRDLACTFISVVIHGDSLAVAHIGDGAVIIKRGEELIVVSEPGDSEYANEVTPLTSKKWEEALRITPVYSGISGIMAFSDGIQRAALRKLEDRRIAYKGFCDPLFSFAEETTDAQAGEQELKDFLASKKLSDHSEDDKTVILATITKNDQVMAQ